MLPWLLCAALAAVVLTLCVRLVLLQKTLDEISTQLGERLGTDTNNPIFLSSRDPHAGQLVAELNVQLKELRRLRQRYENGDRELKEAVTNVSHDLRTPLTMIKGYAEVMRDLPGENTPENVQIIIDEAGRLNDLVNDLLDLSRLQAGVLELKRERFDLTESIREILTRYDKLADFKFPFQPGESVYVVADKLKISQVVYNLINNAVNYAGEDKTVALSQEVMGDHVRISVTDTGEGIPQDRLRDIWDRYYKVDREHRRAQVGTGLGLSIVKNVLDLHGGSYGVISELGKGSTFWFQLPIDKEGNDDNESETAE